jgi:hypothetical protein
MYGRLIKLALVGIALGMVYQALPDIKRYLAMSRM